MSDDDVGEDDSPAPSLRDLIRQRMRERGWSYSDLERMSDRTLTRGRWQQLGSGVPQRRFPDPESLEAIARVLHVDITTVVLAAAKTVGLDVARRRSGISALLPEHTERLSEGMRDAVLTLIRAAVADATAGGSVDAARTSSVGGLRLEWPKSAAPSESSGSSDSG